MKKILFITSIVLAVFGNAQVGINTPSPTNTLDVNGDLNIAKELRTGGTDLLKGSAGTAGYILHNNAALGSNDWKDIKIADGQGSMSVFSMNTIEDKTGISFTGDGLTTPYSDGDALSANGWTVIPGATDTFSITNGNNKVTFSFRTTAQKLGTGSTGYACGVFVDDQLRAVRTDVILGETGAYKIFNLNATLTNLGQKNNYTVKVACNNRNLNGGTLGIGRAVHTDFLNADMSQSVLTTTVLQPY